MTPGLVDAHTHLVFAGSLGSMPPLLKSDDGRNTVIRPLCYAPEQELEGQRPRSRSWRRAG